MVPPLAPSASPRRPSSPLLLPSVFVLLLLRVAPVPAPPLQRGLWRVGTSAGGQRLKLGERPEIEDPGGRLIPPSRLENLTSRVWGRASLAWHARLPPWEKLARETEATLRRNRALRARVLDSWRGSRWEGWRRHGGAPPWRSRTRSWTRWASSQAQARWNFAFLETGAPVPAPALAPPLQVPRSIADLKRLQRQLVGRLQEEPLGFVCAFSLLYVALQALTIPGSTILNVAAGCLFGFLPGLLLVTLLVTAGSLASYGLSALLLCQVLEQWMPARLDLLRSQVAAHRDRLLNFLLFLRLSPVVPSWFINMGSPVAGVPWRTFALASLLGFLPHTSVQVHAGCVLSTISSLHDLYSVKVLVLLFLFSLLALVPIVLRSTTGTSIPLRE